MRSVEMARTMYQISKRLRSPGIDSARLGIHSYAPFLKGLQIWTSEIPQNLQAVWDRPSEKIPIVIFNIVISDSAAGEIMHTVEC